MVVGPNRKSARRGRASVLVLSGVIAAQAMPAAAHETSLPPIYGDGAIDNALATHHHDAQHEGEDGHLPAGSANVELVGRAHINQDEQGRVADVGVFGDYAYLGASGSRDARRAGSTSSTSATPPRRSRSTSSAPPGHYVGEGVQVIHIDTACVHRRRARAGQRDVPEATPARPASSLGRLDAGRRVQPEEPPSTWSGASATSPTTDGSVSTVPHESHSVFMWDAGDQRLRRLGRQRGGAPTSTSSTSPTRARRC